MFMPNAMCSDTNTRSNPQPSSSCAQSVRCSQLAGASAENDGIPMESCIEAMPYVNRSGDPRPSAHLRCCETACGTTYSVKNPLTVYSRAGQRYVGSMAV